MSTRRWLLVTVVLVLWGLATHSTYAGQGDEPHYLAIAHSIAFDFDLDVANNYGPSEPLIAEGNLAPGGHARQGRDGVLRPAHDIGMPLLFAAVPRIAVPAVSAIVASFSTEALRRFRLTPSTLYRHAISAVMILVAALLALQMLETLVDIGASPRDAMRWSLLLALSPPLLIMSILFFTEVLSALVCLTVFRVVNKPTERSSLRWTGAGALVGLLLLMHVRNVGLVAALGGLAIWTLARRRGWSAMVGFAAGATIVLAVRTFVNFWFWGTWVTSPHAHVGEWVGASTVIQEVGRRTAGLLVDQEFGLLLYAPIFLLAAPGLYALARTERRLFGLVTILCAAYLLPILFPFTNPHGWTGGWSPVARFLVPIVPLLGIAAFRGARTVPRAVVAGVVVVQIAVNAYFWQNPKNLWNDGDGIAAVCSRGGATFCTILPSFVVEAERQRRE